ncbi:hypothetical protein [Psychrobacter sp. I-STPA10]|uniref:hypothetical protein n=1 Tax=Psychrobacter sp. I-STPA10 TaxID=2585769 RepID=UPI001E2D08F5|nr:hypothetical protein [Psychrobacter sp. I-STPA10]
MQKITTIATITIAFLLGCLVTYIAMTKQQMDRLLQAKQQAVMQNQQSSKLDNPIINDDSSQDNPQNSSDLSISVNQADPDKLIDNHQPQASINEYTEEQAKALINDMPDFVLGQYIDKFMSKDASSVIADKRRFAERAVEELYKKNDNQPLVGEVRLSFDAIMPATSIDTTKINKHAKIYAHLDTRGQVPASPYVFVKWVNNETGQVLLFEKKDIVADSNQNWVSFLPYDGWQVGSYDIRFYQFTSELQPVAQLTYHIYEVMEDN